MSTSPSPHGGHSSGLISVGEIIQTTFRVFFAKAGAFCAIALIVQLPWLLFELFAGEGVAGADPGISYVRLAALLFASLLISNLMMSTVVFGTLSQMSGQQAGTGEIVSRGLGEILPSLQMAFAAALVFMIGFLLFVVPGLFFTVVFAVIMPVYVVERPGIRGCFERSWALTQGNRWQIFGVLMAFFAIAVVFALLVNALSAAFVFIPGAAVIIADYLAPAVSGALMAILSSVLYYELRLAQGGRGPEETAAVFD